MRTRRLIFALLLLHGVTVAAGQVTVAINELMPGNEGSLRDETGEYDDWIEITNSGPDAVDLSGYYLTDDIAYPFKFAFPDTVIQPDEYFIVWADDDPEQGSMHAEFKLSSSGEGVYLLYSLLLVDETVFPALGEDVSFGRWPDTSGAWDITPLSTRLYFLRLVQGEETIVRKITLMR